MSFSFNFHGSPKAVSAACDEVQSHESPHATAAKLFVKSLLAGAPEGTSVFVEANGHHNYDPSSSYSSGFVDMRFRLGKSLPEPGVVESLKQAE